MSALGRRAKQFTVRAMSVAIVVAIGSTLPAGMAQAEPTLGQAGVATDPISLSKPYYFFTGLKPNSVATADFDGDGNVDMVTADGQSRDLGVLFGQGRGRFARAQFFELTGAPYTVVAADFDGDSAPDLAVTAGNSVEVLIGDGRGNFSTPTKYTVGSTPVDLEVSDFDSDGVPDLVALNDYVPQASDLSVLLGNGDGTFAPAVSYSVGEIPQGVDVGDLDGDGAVDLVVSEFRTTSVRVLLGDGDGGFGAPSATTVPGTPRDVALGDFDGDGRLDVAVTTDDANITVLRGDGRGGLTPERTFRVIPGTYGLVSADMNGDGLADLVSSAGFSFLDGGHRSITVVINDGGVGFLDPVVTSLRVPNVTAPAIADLDGNGTPDIAFAAGNGERTQQRGARAGVLFQDD